MCWDTSRHPKQDIKCICSKITFGLGKTWLVLDIFSFPRIQPCIIQIEQLFQATLNSTAAAFSARPSIFIGSSVSHIFPDKD